MKPTIYHNPRCTKSRQTLRLIEDHGHSPEIVEYLKEPPSVDELDRICHMLGIEPVELVRSNESRLKELGAYIKDKKSRAEWLAILAANPILIERPIVVVDGKAVLGRPPENVIPLL